MTINDLPGGHSPLITNITDIPIDETHPQEEGDQLLNQEQGSMPEVIMNAVELKLKQLMVTTNKLMEPDQAVFQIACQLGITIEEASKKVPKLSDFKGKVLFSTDIGVKPNAKKNPPLPLSVTAYPEGETQPPTSYLISATDEEGGYQIIEVPVPWSFAGPGM